MPPTVRSGHRKKTDILSYPHTQGPRKKELYIPPSSIRGSEIPLPPPQVKWLVRSHLENENFRSLIRRDKLLRSTLRASQSGCTALFTETTQLKVMSPS